MSRSSSTTRTTRRARFTRRAAIAAIATAGLGAGLAAGTGTAFADDGPGSVLSGTVVVGSTLTIHPSAQNFSITAVPGVPVTSAYNIVVHSTDSAGYDLTQSLSQQFGGIPDSDWTLGQEQNGGHQTPWFTTPVTYDAGGDAITLYTTTTLSGTNPAYGGTAPGQPVFSDPTAGTDTITTDVGLTLPGQFPGSPANGYQGAFTLALIGH